MLLPLVIHWHVNPVICHLGPLELRWYSLLWISGFIFGPFMFRWFFRREKLPESLVDPFLYSILLGTIVGARLGHCLFYQPDYYLGSWQGFLEIFQPWKGGLSSHGGAFGMLLAVWWLVRKYGKKYGFDYIWIMDRLCLVVCFGGACIRLGNLFNSEIYGDVTNLPWGVVFDLRGETEPKHPTQIYESLSYLILGICLITAYTRKLEKLKRGQIFGIFLIVLFGMRILIEFIKEPQVEFETSMFLNMGQLLSLPFFIAGFVILIWSSVKGKPAMVTPPSAVKPVKQETHYAHSVKK